MHVEAVMLKRPAKQGSLALYDAGREASWAGSDEADIHHLLLAFTQDETQRSHFHDRDPRVPSVAAVVLQRLGVPRGALRAELLQSLPAPVTSTGKTYIGSSPALQAITEAAYGEAQELGAPSMGSEHLLLALLRSHASQVQTLARYGVDWQKARAEVVRLQSEG